MRARVRFATPSGAEVELAPGDVIGRLPFAALHLADPRVSEAHAMVSLRAGELVLLALRRRFQVDDRVLDELVLEPGLEINFGGTVCVTVLEVELPAEVLGLRVRGLPTMPLPPVVSLFGGDPPRIHAGYDARAGAVIFSEGSRFLSSMGGRAPCEVRPGEVVEVEGARFELVLLPIREVEAANTVAQPDAAARVWELFHDVVKVRRGEEEIMSLSGHTARVISELAAIGQPAPWESVAREIWRDDADVHTLRRRWDMALGRMRHKLREARLPLDVVRADGAGNVELRLPGADRVEDRS